MGDNQRIITQFINTIFLRPHNYSMYHQLLSDGDTVSLSVSKKGY